MFRRFFCDERGLESVEFAILAGLIAAGAIAALTAIGVWVAAQFTSAQSQLGA